MSRTRVRVVLILIAFILVMAAILSGILTYWVGAEDLPAPTPEPGESDHTPAGSGQPVALDRRLPRSPFAAG